MWSLKFLRRNLVIFRGSRFWIIVEWDVAPPFLRAILVFDFDGWMETHTLCSSLGRPCNTCAKRESWAKSVILVKLLIQGDHIFDSCLNFSGFWTCILLSCSRYHREQSSWFSFPYIPGEQAYVCSGVGAEGTSFSESKAFSNDHQILDPLIPWSKKLETPKTGKQN